MSVSASRAVPEYLARGHEVILEKRSAYQHIVIAEAPGLGRLLYLDGDLQIAESDEVYNRAMIEPLVKHGAVGKVLILGGGDGGVLKAALQEGAQRAVLVDIDREVIELSKRYLPRVSEDAFESENAEVVIGDAFAYLDRSEEWDGIIYDLTMEPVGVKESRPTFIARVLDKVLERLRPGGVFSMQCCSEHDPQLRQEILKAMQARFEQVEENLVDVPSYDERWVFASGVKPQQ